MKNWCKLISSPAIFTHFAFTFPSDPRVGSHGTRCRGLLQVRSVDWEATTVRGQAHNQGDAYVNNKQRIYKWAHALRTKDMSSGVFTPYFVFIQFSPCCLEFKIMFYLEPGSMAG